jgi:hypothetical protein
MILVPLVYKGKVIHGLFFLTEHYTMKAWKYSSIHSLTSAPDGGEWSVSCPGPFAPRKETLVPIGAGLDAVAKRRNSQLLLGLEPPIVQSVTQRL